jgi:glycosyltransferase involved in cell wall biosynthesis
MVIIQGDLAGLWHVVGLVATVVVQRGHALKQLRVLVLTRYGGLGASSRLRSMQYFPALRSAGMQVQWQSLFGDAALEARYTRGQYGVGAALAAYAARIQAMRKRRDFDVVWIEKEALPYLPLWLESTLLSGVPYVLDYDDAVFHNYDQHRIASVRWFYGSRLDRLMSKASLVVCGNQYLADRAQRAGAPWVELLPTVIDLARYPVPTLTNTPVGDGVLRIVWIGSPTTAQYLQILAIPLQKLAQRLNFVLRVIGAEVQLPGVQMECVPWIESTEVECIAAGHVGVMPLQDSAWERGKCGYKLIQYMACGLPVVASPVGVNSDIVESGVNGYLASSDEEWVASLEVLLTQSELRLRLGSAGRAKVVAQYCIQKTGPKLAELLHSAAKGN